MSEPIKLYEILVPTTIDNKKVLLSHHKDWDKFVRKISGGLTVLVAAKGQWIHPVTKEAIAEKVIPVRVACTANQLEQILTFTISHYDQLVVMAYVVSEEVIIKHKPEEK